MVNDWHSLENRQYTRSVWEAYMLLIGQLLEMFCSQIKSKKWLQYVLIDSVFLKKNTPSLIDFTLVQEHSSKVSIKSASPILCYLVASCSKCCDQYTHSSNLYNLIYLWLYLAKTYRYSSKPVAPELYFHKTMRKW